VNKPWLNAVAAIIVGVLLVLSGTLMVTTVFPHVDVTTVVAVIAAALAVGGVAAMLVLRTMARRQGEGRPPAPAMSPAEKLSWRMPPLALLKPVKWSTGTKLGMLSLRVYLVLAAILLLVKAIQLGGA
jgi:hypothetical protein